MDIDPGRPTTATATAVGVDCDSDSDVGVGVDAGKKDNRLLYCACDSIKVNSGLCCVWRSSATGDDGRAFGADWEQLTHNRTGTHTHTHTPLGTHASTPQQPRTINKLACHAAQNSWQLQHS